MRIGIDAMGGDFAPEVPVKGALAARSMLAADDRIVLIGDEAAIRSHLNGQADWQSFIRIEPAEGVIGMDETPVEALRAKPRSSIARMAELAARKEVDAIVSAGNTGACVAAAQMRLRRLAGVHRPGIAIVIPTFHGPVVMCDVGANPMCRPMHLYQYGIMSAEYSRALCGVAEPRVGLLSIGEEDAKGNPLVKETRALMKDGTTNYIGNVEGRDIFRGVCDVVVCDGFVGNVCLKLMEGLSEGLFKSIMQELHRKRPDMAEQFQQAAAKIAETFDFNEYGGAPLLGVNGVCIICHGASQCRAIAKAARVAADFARRGLNARIVERISKSQGQADD